MSSITVGYQFIKLHQQFSETDPQNAITRLVNRNHLVDIEIDWSSKSFIFITTRGDKYIVTLTANNFNHGVEQVLTLVTN